jgi:tRNA(adenine34) deaminase
VDLADTELDDRMMRLALEEARAAAAGGDVPVGAVVARADAVVARAGNARERDQDPTAHAEILALRRASAALGSWHLEGCTIYVTLEPCAMCAGALVLARVDRLVFGAPDPKAGFVGSLGDLARDERLNHVVDVTAGVLAESCGEVLRDFFRERR